MNKTYFLAIISFLLISPFISTAQFGGFGGGFSSHSTYYHHGITYKQAKERGDNLKPWWRQEIGLYMPVASLTYTHVYQTFDDNTGNLLNSVTNSRTVMIKPTVGLTEGTFMPILTLRDKSMLALAYQAMIYWGNIDIPQEQLGAATYSGSCDVLECGVGLSLDYKLGCDAELSTNKKTGITFGAGYYPNYIFAGIKHDFVSGNMAFDPFLKVDFSFFMGVCFKLKAMAIFRTTYYLQSFESDVIPQPHAMNSTDYNAVSISGSPTFSLSLVVLPYSYDWGND